MPRFVFDLWLWFPDRGRFELVVESGGLGAGVDVEFFVDASAVGVHGVGADAEGIRDFLTEVTLGEEVEDFFFAFGELAQIVFLADGR